MSQSIANLEYAMETALSIIQQPQGSLWNYGTSPTKMELAEWKGRKEAAQEIYDALTTPPNPNNTEQKGE